MYIYKLILMHSFSIPTFEAAPQSQPMKILAIGDSLIYGYGDTEGGGWVDRLKREWMKLDNRGCTSDRVLYNLGVRGNCVKHVNQRLESEFMHRGEVRNRYPDAIFLSVGVNDTARLGHANGRNFTKIEDFETEVAHLLDNSLRLVSSESWRDRVLFIGMVPVDEAKMPFSNSLYFNRADQYRYKQSIEQACQVRHIPYLDIFDLWEERGSEWCRQHLSEDGLHPNSMGYQALLSDIMSWQPMQKLSIAGIIR